MDRPVPGGGKCCEETHLGTGTEVSGVLFLIGWREKSSQILEDAEREAPWELGKRAFQTEERDTKQEKKASLKSLTSFPKYIIHIQHTPNLKF